MRFRLPVVIMAVAAFWCAPVFAADTTAAAGHHDGNEWFKGLNLSADQTEKLKALRDEMKPLRQATQDQMRALREKSKDELLKANPSKSVLDDLARQMGEVHHQTALKEHEHLLKIKAILSKEQFEKLLSHDPLRDGGPRKPGGPGAYEGRGGGGPKDND
jgi:Spy/CpxP family protein refolding chaperone